MIKSRIVLFFVSFVIWLIFTWSVEKFNILGGLFASLIIALIVGDLFTENPRKAVEIKRYLWFVVYVIFFLWDMLKTNLDIAISMFRPRLDINPGIIKVETNFKSKTAITMLAHTIVLVSGMGIIDIDENRHLYVHCLQLQNDENEKYLRDKISRYEKIIGKVFE
ncbi:Na+/H+ antiporter subunit E [Elusimicrobiota bacterium]